MSVRRDAYSEFGFFQALKPQDVATGSATEGETIDLQGYDGATIVVNIGAFTSAGSFGSAGNKWQFMLQHGLPSDAGVSVWSDVGIVNILHSAMGSGGATSTMTSGIWLEVGSLASAQNTIQAVGYLGDTTHRYLRLKISYGASPSTFSAGAVAVLTRPSNWPVRDPVGH